MGNQPSVPRIADVLGRKAAEDRRATDEWNRERDRLWNSQCAQYRAKVAAVKPRDQVVTGGGIVGKVTRVDDDYADVEIAQGVKIKVVKSTLADVLQPGGKPAND